MQKRGLKAAKALKIIVKKYQIDDRIDMKRPIFSSA